MVLCLEPEAESSRAPGLPDSLCDSLGARRQPEAAAAALEQTVQTYPVTTISWVSIALYTGTAITTRIQIIIDVEVDGSLFARRGTNGSQQCQKVNILLSCFHYRTDFWAVITTL